MTIRAAALALVGVMMSFAGTTLAARRCRRRRYGRQGPDGRDCIAGLALREGRERHPQGEDDYVASCEDGHRYRVFVNADGRVVVEKLD